MRAPRSANHTLLAAGLLLLGAATLPRAASASEETSDLRGISVGMPASALPADGFAGFTCADHPETKPDGWRNWAACPTDANGLHALRFNYAAGETKVAGHPVLLRALFDGTGRLETLRIETEPTGPLFMRKKAFLLGLQAQHRYGDDGWTCVDAPPGPEEEAVGGVFMKQTCRKATDGRGVMVERTLLRRAGNPPSQFVGATLITVTAAP